ncbi:Receptor tyrosine-protein kinase [Dirofilaria immitis]
MGIYRSHSSNESKFKTEHCSYELPWCKYKTYPKENCTERIGYLKNGMTARNFAIVVRENSLHKKRKFLRTEDAKLCRPIRTD